MRTTSPAHFFSKDKMQRAGSQPQVVEVRGQNVLFQAQHHQLELLAHALPIGWLEPR